MTNPAANTRCQNPLPMPLQSSKIRWTFTLSEFQISEGRNQLFTEACCVRPMFVPQRLYVAAIALKPVGWR